MLKYKTVILNFVKKLLYQPQNIWTLLLVGYILNNRVVLLNMTQHEVSHCIFIKQCYLFENATPVTLTVRMIFEV